MELMDRSRPPEQRTLSTVWANFIAELRGARQDDRRRAVVDYYRTEMFGRPYLKIIGQRWINRGPSYWIRRAGWSFGQFLIAAMMSMFAIEATVMVLVSKVQLFLTIPLMVIWWLSVVPGFIYPWRRLQVFGFTRKARIRYTAGSPIIGLAFGILLPVLAGMTMAIFLSTLRRDFPGESAAREAYRSCRADSPQDDLHNL